MVSLIFLKNKIRNNERVFKKTHGEDVYHFMYVDINVSTH